MSIETTLDEHELELSVFISDIGTCAAPDCDWRKGSMRNGEVAAAHRAHLADLIRAALTGDEVVEAAFRAFHESADSRWELLTPENQERAKEYHRAGLTAAGREAGA